MAKARVLEYKDYTTNITFDPSASVYKGKIENIPENISFRNKTFKGVEIAFRRAVDDYIKTLEPEDDPEGGEE